MDLAGCVSASQRRVPSATAPKTSAKLGNVSLVIGHKSRQVAKVDVAVPHQDVIVSSHAVQRVAALPHGTDPKDVPIHSRDVATPAKSLDTAPSVPWWAILAGLLLLPLLLLLLTLLPWKVRERERDFDHCPRHGQRNVDDEVTVVSFFSFLLIPPPRKN
ncbi:uncharacterized protein LOC126994874 [Eriocheir sinensis]|uniref:uncharacterized protein LOC126994874 n=1 Tax=Eriocheir sinensis TaxID=95602 RepID=UPI0021C59957|nr:uncharacterized protein LOC126994874 [Eriocheir sinensis]